MSKLIVSLFAVFTFVSPAFAQDQTDFMVNINVHSPALANYVVAMKNDATTCVDQVDHTEVPRAPLPNDGEMIAGLRTVTNSAIIGRSAAVGLYNPEGQLVVGTCQVFTITGPGVYTYDVSRYLGLDGTPDGLASVKLTIAASSHPRLSEYRVVVLPEGGNCDAITDDVDAQARAGMLFAYPPGMSETIVYPRVGEVFSVCTYHQVVGGKYEYVLRSLVLDQERIEGLWYILEFSDAKPQPVVVTTAPTPLTWSAAVTGGAALQPGQILPEFMVRGTYRSGYLRFVAGLGMEGTVIPTQLMSPRGVFELGGGGGLTTAIPSTKLTFDGLLALVGGVRPFQVRCGPEAYKALQVYTCGHDGVFPVVFTGPWIGPQAQLAVLGPFEANHLPDSRIGGQVVITAPVHVGSNTWPAYQEVGGRTVTVHTTDGDREIRYQWEGDAQVFAYPVVTGGIVVMW